MNTITKLTRLFDYQRFENNNRLQNLIDDTKSRFAHAMTDEDMYWVNAAGEEHDFKDGKDKGSNE